MITSYILLWVWLLFYWSKCQVGNRCHGLHLFRIHPSDLICSRKLYRAENSLRECEWIKRYLISKYIYSIYSLYIHSLTTISPYGAQVCKMSIQVNLKQHLNSTIRKISSWKALINIILECDRWLYISAFVWFHWVNVNDRLDILNGKILHKGYTTVWKCMHNVAITK